MSSSALSLDLIFLLGLILLIKKWLSILKKRRIRLRIGGAILGNYWSEHHPDGASHFSIAEQTGQ